MTHSRTGDQLAVMANVVAEARHCLTVPEQRLILWLVSRIERQDDCFKEFTLSVLEFEELLGESNNGRLYEQIEAVCDRLQTRVLELRTGPQERTKFNWLDFARYHDGKGKVTLQFHHRLGPVLLQLKERFCCIPIKSLFRLRGGYAIRWLEMLHSRRHEGSFYLSVAELRDWLHIEPEELKTVDHLRSRAIDYPKRELDRVSDFTFTYEPKKEGRRITGWTFTVKENKPKAAAKKPRKAVAAKAPEAPAERLTPDKIQQLRREVVRRETTAPE